jgi:uncharacterized protein YcbX
VHVAEIWRYPVKSLAGERLEVGELTAAGIPGDRSLHVRDDRDAVLTARRAYALVTVPATLDTEGKPLIDGDPWDSDAAARRVREASGDGARLVESKGGHLHDDTPLLVATDGALQSLGEDRRRFRPNLVIAGTDGLDERKWPGWSLQVGDAVIGVDHLCERCVVTTLDPDTGDVDPSILTRIRSELDGLFALNCSVRRPGRVAVGDRVVLA